MVNPPRWDMKSGDVAGISASCKNAHECHTDSHDESEMRHMPRASRVRFRDFPVPTLQHYLQYSRAQLTLHIKLHVRPETVNPGHSLKHCKACCPFRMF